jgi:uncharacterized protein (DUF433 family)
LYYKFYLEESMPMTDQQLLENISFDPTVVVRKPVIRGTRLTVEYILGLLAHGATVEEILKEYEGLILVTNDKDFGEKVYRERLPHRGVILLRLDDERPRGHPETWQTGMHLDWV